MIAVLRFPGSNCDDDARHALADVLGVAAEFVWHRSPRLPEGARGVVVPGGFSYGDYLRSGAMAAHSPIMADVRRFGERGGPVLGICNGFQILTESGLLPGQLGRNDSLRFVCRPVRLRVERSDVPLLSDLHEGDVIEMPVAHHDGKYYLPDDELAALEARGGVAFRYVDADGRRAAGANPNGSVNDIAGVLNEAGNVLGMMPHPERAVEALLGAGDGRAVLRSFVRAAAEPVAS